MRGRQGTISASAGVHLPLPLVRRMCVVQYEENHYCVLLQDCVSSAERPVVVVFHRFHRFKLQQL